MCVALSQSCITHRMCYKCPKFSNSSGLFGVPLVLKHGTVGDRSGDSNYRACVVENVHEQAMSA